MLGRFGRLLFSLAIVGIGVETLICSYVSSHSLGPHYKVVPVIPWVPAIPSLAYPVGAILILCGASLLFQRTVVVSSITLGVLMLLCGLAFNVPRHPNLMSPEWRTNVLEPIAIGSLAWLAPGLGGIPRWLYRTSRYLLAFALIVFGIAHFQVLTFIASLVPDWIPWHSFWTVFFGVAFIAAGASFATGFLQRWAALGGGTDVRALDRNHSPTRCSQLFPRPGRNSRPGQVVGRVHCRSAVGRLVGDGQRAGITATLALLVI